MDRFQADGAHGSGLRYLGTGVALSVAILLASEPVCAQTAPPASPSFQSRVEETARALASDPRLKRVSPQKREALVEFIVGNMLFVAAHEVGHAVIGQMELPVLGREEDAADSFAILTAVRLGNAFSHRVLTEAAQGYLLSERRDKKQGIKFAYYGEHGMNLQRGYQIVCFVVGSDPKKYQELAERTNLPEDRQDSCRADFNNTTWSWDTLLKPHRRATDQPKQKIDVKYGEGEGALKIHAEAFRNMRFLESLAELVADRFVWPHPITMEMKSCGSPNGRWRASVRTLELCYELAQEFGQLYRDYGKDLAPSAAKPKRGS